jgi:hypothetical protein
LEILRLQKMQKNLGDPTVKVIEISDDEGGTSDDASDEGWQGLSDPEPEFEDVDDGMSRLLGEGIISNIHSKKATPNTAAVSKVRSVTDAEAITPDPRKPAPKQNSEDGSCTSDLTSTEEFENLSQDPEQKSSAKLCKGNYAFPLRGTRKRSLCALVSETDQQANESDGKLAFSQIE